MDSSSTQQVFVIGCPRSGTSALSWALAENPSLWTSAESDFMHMLFKKDCLFNVYKNSVERPDVGWLQQNDVTYKEFASFIGSGINNMFKSRSNGLIWIDQTPGYTLIAPVLKDLFPNAKFIHIVRDGKDVVSSMLNSGFENLGFSMKWTSDFENACQTWKTYVLKGRSFVASNPDVAIQIRNEDMVQYTNATFSTLQRFLDISENDGPAKFISNSRVNSSYDNGFKKKKINPSASESENIWSSENKKIFYEICGDLIEELNYNKEIV